MDFDNDGNDEMNFFGNVLQNLFYADSLKNDYINLHENETLTERYLCPRHLSAVQNDINFDNSPKLILDLDAYTYKLEDNHGIFNENSNLQNRKIKARRSLLKKFQAVATPDLIELDSFTDIIDHDALETARISVKRDRTTGPNHLETSTDRFNFDNHQEHEFEECSALPLQQKVSNVSEAHNRSLNPPLLSGQFFEKGILKTSEDTVHRELKASNLHRTCDFEDKIDVVGRSKLKRKVVKRSEIRKRIVERQDTKRPLRSTENIRNEGTCKNTRKNGKASSQIYPVMFGGLPSLQRVHSNSKKSRKVSKKCPVPIVRKMDEKKLKLVCGLCQPKREYALPMELAKHLKTDHPNLKTGIACVQCCQVFTDHSILQEHMETHFPKQRTIFGRPTRVDLIHPSESELEGSSNDTGGKRSVCLEGNTAMVAPPKELELGIVNQMVAPRPHFPVYIDQDQGSQPLALPRRSKVATPAASSNNVDQQLTEYLLSLPEDYSFRPCRFFDTGMNVVPFSENPHLPTPTSLFSSSSGEITNLLPVEPKSHTVKRIETKKRVMLQKTISADGKTKIRLDLKKLVAAGFIDDRASKTFSIESVNPDRTVTLVAKTGKHWSKKLQNWLGRLQKDSEMCAGDERYDDPSAIEINVGNNASCLKISDFKKMLESNEFSRALELVGQQCLSKTDRKFSCKDS